VPNAHMLAGASAWRSFAPARAAAAAAAETGGRGQKDLIRARKRAALSHAQRLQLGCAALPTALRGNELVLKTTTILACRDHRLTNLPREHTAAWMV